ncbi:hypothetical protein GYMLUDRAFT_244094 [Collybiopsis luxurians FD-317 M1]|uniref:Uncharacterized protein n=1 Tax=Collybiopsis luxurians FD-317 M1 TaxID=944289 RepID=A0A0D0BYQ2_9AGAR|nr:hypothetical protein GYMLUDRAFT_244094 [Collybiopsis luxurians FD-317 M1]
MAGFGGFVANSAVKAMNDPKDAANSDTYKKYPKDALNYLRVPIGASDFFVQSKPSVD